MHETGNLDRSPGKDLGSDPSIPQCDWANRVGSLGWPIWGGAVVLLGCSRLQKGHDAAGHPKRYPLQQLGLQGTENPPGPP